MRAAAALIAAATVVRTSAARGRTRPVSPTTVVRLAGVIARRWSRLIRAASAIAATAAAAVRSTATVVRRAGAVGLRGPRIIRAASAVTATGAAIGRRRSLTNDGRAYWKCARLRTGASDVFPEVAPAAAIVGCGSELTSRRRPVRIHVLTRYGYVGPIDLSGSIASLTESMPTTVVARASDSRRCRHGLRAGWFAGTAPTAAGL